MPEKLDATSRLAEGLPAVDNVQNYVWACHLLGYQCPDLTLHASQVRDWYASEDGLDLSVLAADCAAFERVVAATEQALVRQDDQLAAMSGAWSGYGADASREFLRRHGEASASAAASVRTAADALASLRDRLWHAVDGKVATALAVEDRVAQRAEWLAAAQTVMTSAGDRAAASELVDHQVKPFVDNDIRAEWLTAMRAALAAVADSYEAATAELTAESAAVFDVPGDLGPSWTPPPRSDDVATTPAAAASSPAPVVAPASWSAPPVSPPMSATPPLMPPPAAPIEPLAPAMPPTGSMSPMGGGIPDIGSGLSGFGQQLADTLGGLVGSADDAIADTPDLDEELEEHDDLDELEEPDDELEEPADPDETIDEPIEDPACEDACGEPQADTAPPVEPSVEPPPVEPPPEPAPTPAPMPPPPEPLPSPEPLAATETPCEIAADELPQVGE